MTVRSRRMSDLRIECRFKARKEGRGALDDSGGLGGALPRANSPRRRDASPTPGGGKKGRISPTPVCTRTRPFGSFRALLRMYGPHVVQSWL
jgi:hypothetical protein